MSHRIVSGGRGHTIALPHMGRHAAGLASPENRAARDGGAYHLPVLILAASCFVSGLNVNVLSPLMPSIGQTFDVSDAAVGQLATLHATIAGVLAVAIAPVIDRYPRRAVLRIELAILLLAMGLSALAPSFGWLFAGQALAGLGGAIIGGICLAATGDLFVDERQRNRAIGTVSAAFSIATIAGLPLITEVSNIVGWRWAMAVLLAPTALVVLGTSWLPAAVVRAPAEAADHHRYREALENWQVNWLLAGVIVVCLVMAGWQVYFGAYTTAVFGISANALSLLFLAAGVGQLLAAETLALLLRLGSARTVFVLVALVESIAFLSMSLVGGAWWQLLPFVVILSAGMTTLYLSTTVLLLDSQPAARGAVMALQTGCFEFGWALGTAVTGGALVLLGSYPAVYATLGLILPLSLLFLAISRGVARRPGPSGGRTSPSLAPSGSGPGAH